MGIILNKIKIENEEEMGMGRLCVMKQTKALQNSVVSMTHLVLSVKAKKIALFVLYLLFIRRQNILSYWIQYFHFLKKIHILFELFELVQKNMQKKTHSYFIRKLVHTESKCWNKRVNLSYCNLLCQSNKSKTLFVYVFIGLLLSVGLAFVWPYSRIRNQISLSSFFSRLED